MSKKITNSNLTAQKEKAKHEVEVLPTPIPDVKAKINCQYYTDGSVALSAYLIDAKTGIRHDADIKAGTKAAVIEQLPEKMQFLVGRMTQEYQKTVRQAVSVKLSSKPYSQAYESLTDEERISLCPTTWRAPSTRKHGLAYFAHTMLPLLDSIGLNIDAIDCGNILADMQKAAEQSGNFRGNPAAAYAKAAQHAKDFNFLYPRLCNLRPQYGLPDIVLQILCQKQSVQPEQCKAMPEAIRVKLAAVLLRLIPNGLALGGVLMLTAMPRTAEACAPTFGDIVFFDTYAVYGVLWQSDGKVRIQDLKSKSSFRAIILPKYAVDALRMRMAWLRDQGFSDEEILKLPVVSAANDPTQMASPNALSAFLRLLLSLLGFTSDYWAAVHSIMNLEPDLNHDKTPLQDPTAYVLRRNGCTMCCNVCGMDPDLVDALMGHALRQGSKTDWKRYICRPDNWPLIAEQLERVIYHPDHSANPAFLPIIIRPDMDVCTLKSGNQSYQFAAPPDKAVDVEIQVDTLEAGDPIIFSAESENTQVSVEPIILGNSNDSTPILGVIHKRSYYEALIKSANDINLSDFLPPK